MKKLFLTSLLICTLLLSACIINIPSSNLVRGSGKVASEARDVSGYSSIELAGSADVSVSFGDEESVMVEAEDNILPLVETKVQNEVLVISLKPNTNIQTSKGIHVTVTMRDLASASLPGSGSITISGLQRERVKIELDGSGNITAEGEVQELQASLSGSGEIRCRDLIAVSTTVEISGSGNAEVYASDRLDASVSGSGSIRYFGEPADVNRNVSGSGSIEEG